MKALSVLILVCAAAAVRGDIPDVVLSWQRSRVLMRPGNDQLVTCARSQDLSRFHALLLNTLEDRWTWSLVSLDRYGKETGSTIILSDSGSMEHWITPCFLPGSLLALALGNRLLPGAAFLLMMESGSEQAPAPVEITGFPDEYGGIIITSMEYSEEEKLVVAGTAFGNGGFLFTAGLDTDGIVGWHREVPGFRGMDIEGTTMEILSDGSFILSIEEDRFETVIDVLRMDSRGNELWRASVSLESEFTAVFNDFLELPDGNILSAGTFDKRGHFLLRGHFVLFDPALGEIWKRVHWYWDNTSFTSVEPTEEGHILCVGWTGSQGIRPFEIEEMNVLLALMETTGDIRGYSIEAEGSQIPAEVFPGGFDEYFVLGEHTPEGEDESDIFWGQVYMR